MASLNQRQYIKDLAVLKLKEFKEFKEMIYSKGIVSPDSEVVANAVSIDGILDATTDLQASRIIDELVTRPAPARSRTYSNRRAKDVMNKLDKIKATVADWDFNELRKLDPDNQ